MVFYDRIYIFIIEELLKYDVKHLNRDKYLSAFKMKKIIKNKNA
tara:strand:+ start:1651 stop:1782 length:132 start_codon:yes stop_codon:yes gene_type:complete